MSLDSHEKSQNSKQNEMIMGQNPSTLVKEQKYMYKKIKIANFVIWQKQKKKNANEVQYHECMCIHVRILTHLENNTNFYKEKNVWLHNKPPKLSKN